MTQVSLTPPPCEELTTSEPSFNATLVSAPFTKLILLFPTKQKGRRSTCLGDNDFLLKMGTEERLIIGCAI